MTDSARRVAKPGLPTNISKSLTATDRQCSRGGNGEGGMKNHATVILRWLAVPPTLVIGYILAPVLFHIVWELDLLVLPYHTWVEWAAECIKSVIGGYCGVWAVGVVAPSNERTVRIICATVLITVLALTSILIGDWFYWLNVVLTGVAAIVAIWSLE